MIEYKIVENLKKPHLTEKLLMELSTEGWTVNSFNQHQILLERKGMINESKDDKQIPLFD